MSDEEKKLPPTQQRLRDAKDRGHVATSRDLSGALGSLAATGVIVSSGAVFMGKMAGQVSQTLRHLGDRATVDVVPGDLTPLVMTGGLLIASTAGTVAVAAAGTGVFTTLVQTSFNYSTKKLALKWERLSPQQGLEKLKPSNAGIETLKAIVVATVLTILAYKTGKLLYVDAVRLTYSHPIESARRGWDLIVRLLWQAGLVLLALGAADYGIQKWRWKKSLMMTKEEHKQEMKNENGNPEIKGRIRRIQRELHRKRMLKAVARATVIITNPTHFAVALEYDRDKNPAPVVVGKGADLMAAKIRQIAREHSIPIMENPPLARALYRECEVGDTIPGPLFGAVAEILAYLIRIKQLVI